MSDFDLDYLRGYAVGVAITTLLINSAIGVALGLGPAIISYRKGRKWLGTSAIVVCVWLSMGASAGRPIGQGALYLAMPAAVIFLIIAILRKRKRGSSSKENPDSTDQGG